MKYYKEIKEEIIKEYSKGLTKEFGREYSTRSLKYTRKYYHFQKRQQVAAQLTWSHYELLSIESVEEVNYHIEVALLKISQLEN